MEKYHIMPYDESSDSGLVRHILLRSGFSTGELLVCLIVRKRTVPHVEELADRLFEIPGMTSFCLNVNRQKGNRILGDEVICVRGQSYITDFIGNVQYHISPKSFFQVNPVQTERLYQKALEFARLSGGETVWDLYCGIGTISLFMAQKAAQVYGVEIVPEAVEDARNNAVLNQLDNVEFFMGKAEEVLPAFYDGRCVEKNNAFAKYISKKVPAHDSRTASVSFNPVDVIVVDPPRKGCAPELLKTMLFVKPKRIVYVSCDPATLARDLKILCESAYRLEKVQPVDMFPQTTHVETVVLMSRAK